MAERSVNVILRPRLIALDSSHIGDLARDIYGTDTERKRAAKSFEDAFNGMGCVLLLSWHHIQELMTHHDEAVVNKRMTFLAALPMVASITSMVDDDTVGSVVDILSRETAAAYVQPEAKALAIRDAVTSQMTKLDSGLRLVAPFLEHWCLLRPMLMEQQERAREIIAISRSDFVGLSHTRMHDWLDGKLRDSEDIVKRLEALGRRLAGDIRSRGDKRILDSEATATGFMDDVVNHASLALDHAAHPGRQLLKSFDIDLDDIDENMTLGDVGELGTFRKKLRVANRNLGLPWHVVKKRIKRTSLPSELIQSALRTYGQDHPEWKGSDLTDSHLACLSAYANTTYVDKRTHENFRRACAKNAEFAATIRQVEKASTYQDIAYQLAKD